MRNWHGDLSPFGKWHTSSLAGALSVYAVVGLEPPLVLDFDETFYRTGGTATDLVNAATHARAGNATMVDSDGVLKWAPHNIILNSEQFSAASWSLLGTSTPVVTPNAGVAPDGTLTADQIVFGAVTNGQVQTTVSVPAGIQYTVAVWLRVPSGTDTIRIGTSTSVSGEFADVTVTTDWQLFSHTTTSSGTTEYPLFGSLTGSGATVFAWGYRMYRADLGGMVNNPSTGDSYVPTTNSARYLPRVGHHIWNGSAWVDEGYLHESEARTNLVTYSQDFTDAGWTKSSTVVVADKVGPDGVINSATTMTDNGSGGSAACSFSKAYAVSTSTVYTWSIYLKEDQLSWVAIVTSGFTSPATGYTYFNLTDGTIGTSPSDHNPTIESVGNGWYRCAINFTTDAADTIGIMRVYLADADGDAIVDRDGTSSILIYGAQFETGSTPSSYIPTSGSTVTRAADTLTIPSANLPWNPLAVSIQMEGTMTYAEDGGNFTVEFTNWEADLNNNLSQTISTKFSTGDFRTRQEVAGVANNAQGLPYSPGINVPFNIASRHGSTFINGAVDGTALTADLTPTALPDLSATDMQIGSTFMGTIKLFRVWADDLTDEGIEEASSNA